MALASDRCLELGYHERSKQDAKDGIYYSQQAFHNLLADHGKKLGIPSHTLQGMLDTAYIAWQRCYKKLAKKPKLKGRRNRADQHSLS